MKRLLICVLVLLLATFSACSKEASSEEKEFGNVNDVEGIYSFIHEEVNSISREEFDENYTAYYLDVNEDGHLDVCYNTEEWYGKLLFISSVEEGFQVVSSDENTMHKINSIHVDDGFIVVTGENIDNAYKDNRTDVYYFDGEVVRFLEQFKTSLFNGAQTYFEGKGTVETIDGYQDLVYTYNQFEVDEYDNKTQHIKIDLSYVFDEETGKYVVTEHGENYDYLANPVSANHTDVKPTTSEQYVLSQLKEGTQIGNFTIQDIDSTGDDIGFSLIGQQEVDGYLVYNMMDDCICIDVDTQILDKPIICDWTSYDYSYELNGFVLYMRNEPEILKQIPAAIQESVASGDRVKVAVTIKDIQVGMLYESEGYEEAEVLDFRIVE